MAEDTLSWLRLPEDAETVIILGMGPQALFLARAYSSYHHRIFMVGEKNWIGYLSRYGKKIIAGTTELQGTISKLLDKFGDKTPILISGGSTLHYYLNNPWLHNLNCYPKPKPSLHILNDKILINNLVENLGLDIKTIPSHPFLEKFQVDFPLIVKWKTDIEEKPFKVLVIYNPGQYSQAFSDFGHLSDYLLVQSLFKKKQSISWGAYCNHGLVEKEVVVHQVRQYPQGLSNYVVEYKGQEVPGLKEVSRQVIKQLDYTGFVEIEFLRDCVADEVYLLEANPRPWGWIDYMKYASDKKKHDKPMINIVRDLYYLLKYEKHHFKGNLVRKSLRYLRCNKVLWSLNDPLPFIGQLFNSLN